MVLAGESGGTGKWAFISASSTKDGDASWLLAQFKIRLQQI